MTIRPLHDGSRSAPRPQKTLDSQAQLEAAKRESNRVQQETNKRIEQTPPFKYLAARTAQTRAQKALDDLKAKIDRDLNPVAPAGYGASFAGRYEKKKINAEQEAAIAASERTVAAANKKVVDTAAALTESELAYCKNTIDLADTNAGLSRFGNRWQTNHPNTEYLSKALDERANLKVKISENNKAIDALKVSASADMPESEFKSKLEAMYRERDLLNSQLEKNTKDLRETRNPGQALYTSPEPVDVAGIDQEIDGLITKSTELKASVAAYEKLVGETAETTSTQSTQSTDSMDDEPDSSETTSEKIGEKVTTRTAVPAGSVEVKEGDTLYSIAKDRVATVYGEAGLKAKGADFQKDVETYWNQVCDSEKANGRKDVNLIYPGETIKCPEMALSLKAPSKLKSQFGTKTDEELFDEAKTLQKKVLGGGVEGQVAQKELDAVYETFGARFKKMTTSELAAGAMELFDASQALSSVDLSTLEPKEKAEQKAFGKVVAALAEKMTAEFATRAESAKSIEDIVGKEPEFQDLASLEFLLVNFYKPTEPAAQEARQALLDETYKAQQPFVEEK